VVGALANSIFTPVLVCYDVADQRTRSKLFETLKDFGLVSVQKSVFWGHLNRAEIKSLERELRNRLDRNADRAFWVRADISSNLKQGIGYEYFQQPEPDGHVIL